MTPSSERAGMVAVSGACTLPMLEAATEQAPWRGPVTWWEASGGSTIAATGCAEAGGNERWAVVAHGWVADDHEVAERLGLDSARLPELVAGALTHERWSPSLLRGAFAAVALDRSNGEIRAVRSFGGARQLARSRHLGATVVATEPAVAVYLASGGRLPVDHRALQCYRDDKPLATETYYEDTHWLPPGSWLVSDTRSTTVSLFDVSARLIDRPRQDAIDAVTASIDRAVERAVVGGGVLGSMATGGLDSSSIVGFAAGHRSVDVAITTRVVAAANSAEEAALAAESVRPLVGRHRIVDLSVSDMIDGVMSWLPMTGPPALLVMGLLTAGYSAAAEAGAGTVLDGLGGDQVFSYSPVREALAESDWPRLGRAIIGARRGAIQPLVQTATARLSGDQRFPLFLPERLRERLLYTDAAVRDRLAAILDVRLEAPYLDGDVITAVAGVPSQLRLPARQLQREAVAKVLPHAHRSIKALYGDVMELHFGMPPPGAHAAARRLFANHWAASVG